jgi:hypothetical protein
MDAPFAEVGFAALPAEALALLAPLRCEPGLEVATNAGRLWLRFETGSERVLRCILPLPGVELFAFRAGAWRRFGQSLPAFDFPQRAHFEPLYQVLVPAPIVPLPPGATAIRSLRLTLAADDRPRPTTAMLCPRAALMAWADAVPSTRLERLHGMTSGEQVLVIGKGLPALAGATRYWGKLVLTPLGYRAAPNLPESALREAAGVEEEELLVLSLEHADAVPRAALGPLSRAALRLVS